MANLKFDATGNRKNYSKHSSHNYSNADALKNLHDYIVNEAKTLSNQIAYIGTPKTTEGFVSAMNYTQQYFEKNDEGKRKADHFIISPSKAEDITAEELLEISKSFVQAFFPHYQGVIGIHENTKYNHAHIMINHINSENGKCAHHSRNDIKKYKTFINSKIEEIQAQRS